MQLDADRDEDEIDEYYDYDASDDLAGPGDAGDSGAYWRRRFIILAGGIAALGLCVWLFPGGRPVAAPTAAAHASAAARVRASGLPSAAFGTAWPGLAAEGPSTAPPSAQPSRTASHPAIAKARKPEKPGERRKSRTSAGTASPSGEPRCAPADIVLSLFTTQASYAPKALPDFSVYAVSTAAAACTLTYGPGSVSVIVTRHGHVVWDSAACQPAAAPRVRFTLGVPRVLVLAWNRHATPSGCAGSLPAGAGGAFAAVAMTTGQSSPVRPFRLDR